MADISLKNVKHVVLILSGKGGVGKSSVTTQLALSLVEQGYRVGVLDIDLTGPSIPRMFGLEGKQVHQSSAGWVPVFTDSTGRLSVMSIGFLLTGRGESVIWRGPKKTAMIRQFISDVVWGSLDYLLIDTPPGTSDEHISIVEQLQLVNPDGAVLVTTSQAVATQDVRKELSFCRKVGLRVLGVVENMSGYICPHCAECTNVFSTGGGEALAQQSGLPFLGKVPLDPSFVLMIEQQQPDKTPTATNTDTSEKEPAMSLLDRYKTSELSPIFKTITDKLIINTRQQD